MTITGHKQCQCLLCVNGNGVNDVLSYTPEYGQHDTCDRCGKEIYSSSIHAHVDVIESRYFCSPVCARIHKHANAQKDDT